MSFCFAYPIIFCAYRMSTSMRQDNRCALLLLLWLLKTSVLSRFAKFTAPECNINILADSFQDDAVLEQEAQRSDCLNNKFT